MPKPTDVHVLEVLTSKKDNPYRCPIKFGGKVGMHSTDLHVVVGVETASGANADGYGAMPLSTNWSFPSSEVDGDTKLAVMMELGKRIAIALPQVCGEPRHPLDHAYEFEPELFRLADDVAGQFGLPVPIPRLCSLVVNSAFDAALNDAFGKANAINIYAGYGPDFVTHDLSRYLDADCLVQRFVTVGHGPRRVVALFEAVQAEVVGAARPERSVRGADGFPTVRGREDLRVVAAGGVADGAPDGVHHGVVKAALDFVDQHDAVGNGGDGEQDGREADHPGAHQRQREEFAEPDVAVEDGAPAGDEQGDVAEARLQLAQAGDQRLVPADASELAEPLSVLLRGPGVWGEEHAERALGDFGDLSADHAPAFLELDEGARRLPLAGLGCVLQFQTRPGGSGGDGGGVIDHLRRVVVAGRDRLGLAFGEGDLKQGGPVVLAESLEADGFGGVLLMEEPAPQLTGLERHPVDPAECVHPDREFGVGRAGVKEDRLEQGGLADVVAAGDNVDAFERLHRQKREAAEVADAEGAEHGGSPIECWLGPQRRRGAL
jgi:hypothetical protein